jgi:dienelactone hydrolase
MGIRPWLALIAAAGMLTAGCTAASPAPAAHLSVRVSDRVSLSDVPLDIQVSGLRPGDHVTVRLESRNQQWAAQATFQARAPVLDLDKTAPTAGSYRGVDGMGLFESLAPRHGGAEIARDKAAVFTVTAAAQGGGTAAVTLTRELTGPGVTCSRQEVSRQEVSRQEVSRHGFYGLYCAPAPQAGRRPPVLVFGGSEGGLSAAPTAELLASRGFPALALAYFGEPGLPAALDRIPLEYFAAAARWLGRQPGTDAQRLTVWGVSRGSEAALLLAADFPALVHAVIAGSPSSVIHGAVALTHPVPPTDPAWMLHGKPLPIATRTVINPGAIIPVGKIEGPVLLLVGGEDQLWPSLFYAQQIMAGLSNSHDRYPHQDLVFPGAGHAAGGAFPYAVNTVTVSTPTATLHLGGTPFANSVAETKAWHDVLTFLNHLGR